MGTSQSSNGSPSGVPMVPPWVPAISGEEIHQSDDGNSESDKDNSQNKPDEDINSEQLPPIAPTGRFGGARTSFSEYARTGERGHMERGLGQYVKKGYGGKQTATRRMGRTVKTAQTLFSALLPENQNPFATAGGTLDPVLLSGRSADEVMDAVVEAVSPVDGTLDAEASRSAIKDALSEVLELFPDADLTNLDNLQREIVITNFVAGDVFRRIDLDLGKTVRAKAPNARTGMKRLREIKDYVREVVSASVRKLKEAGQRLVSHRIPQIVQNAIQETFEVFEGYAT